MTGNEHSQDQPNIWFDDKLLPGFRSNAMKFFDKCRKTQMMVLKALAIGMPGVQPDFFEAYHKMADNQLRLLHCESIPKLDLTQTHRPLDATLTREKRAGSTRTLTFPPVPSCFRMRVED